MAQRRDFRPVIYRMAAVMLMLPLVTGCWFTTVEPAFHQGQQVKFAAAYACVPRDLDRISQSFHLQFEYIGHNRYDKNYSVHFQGKNNVDIAMARFFHVDRGIVLAQVEYDQLFYYLYLRTTSDDHFTIFGVDPDQEQFAEEAKGEVAWVPNGNDVMLSGNDQVVTDFLLTDGRRLASNAIADCYKVQNDPKVSASLAGQS